MNYAFHPEAEAEFVQAIDYYEECEAGLGCDFAGEVYSAIERIMVHPQAWPIIDEDARRSLVSRFPFAIIYAELDKKLFILAVMHLHRDPDYWKRRVR